MTLSEHIKQKRKKNGLSQVELAERSGVGLRFVRDLEHSQCFSKNSQCFSKNSQCFSRKSQCLFSGNPFHLEINELETSKTSLAQMALVPPLLGGFAAASVAPKGAREACGVPAANKAVASPRPSYFIAYFSIVFL